MKILKKLASILGCSNKRDKKRVWIIILKRKAEFTSDNFVPESYVCSNMFASEYDALRHKESLEKEMVTGFEVIDVMPIETAAPVTTAKYNYEISPEHPKISFIYEEVE